jgi:hypothetical protein
MENIGIFYAHLEYFAAIWYNLPMPVWYSLWSFGIAFPIWYVLTKKNLATLVRQRIGVRDRGGGGAAPEHKGSVKKTNRANS